MKTKDEVFSKFQEFKALFENQTGKKIKVLRFDNGGEYTSKDFDAFCREAGIKREIMKNKKIKNRQKGTKPKSLLSILFT
jgi:transposase InsO family protein